MSGQMISAIIIAVVTSGVWPVILPKIIDYKNRQRIVEQQQHEADRETWFVESKRAYNRVQRECNTCTKKLEALNKRFYSLLDALDDLASRPPEEGPITSTELRMVIRKARYEPPPSLPLINDG